VQLKVPVTSVLLKFENEDLQCTKRRFQQISSQSKQFLLKLNSDDICLHTEDIWYVRVNLIP